eukprot:Gb_17389 [translate_table: standard]
MVEQLSLAVSLLKANCGDTSVMTKKQKEKHLVMDSPHGQGESPQIVGEAEEERERRKKGKDHWKMFEEGLDKKDCELFNHEQWRPTFTANVIEVLVQDLVRKIKDPTQVMYPSKTSNTSHSERKYIFNLKLQAAEAKNKMMDAVKELKVSNKQVATLGEDLQFAEWREEKLEELLRKHKIKVPMFTREE